MFKIDHKEKEAATQLTTLINQFLLSLFDETFSEIGGKDRKKRIEFISKVGNDWMITKTKPRNGESDYYVKNINREKIRMMLAPRKGGAFFLNHFDKIKYMDKTHPELFEEMVYLMYKLLRQDIINDVKSFHLNTLGYPESNSPMAFRILSLVKENDLPQSTLFEFKKRKMGLEEMIHCRDAVLKLPMTEKSFNKTRNVMNAWVQAHGEGEPRVRLVHDTVGSVRNYMEEVGVMYYDNNSIRTLNKDTRLLILDDSTSQGSMTFKNIKTLLKNNGFQMMKFYAIFKEF